MLRILVLLSLGYVPAFAYLDPGSGSLLLSSVVAIFASVVFFIKIIFYNLISPRVRLSVALTFGGGGAIPKQKLILSFILKVNNTTTLLNLS